MYQIQTIALLLKIAGADRLNLYATVPVLSGLASPLLTTLAMFLAVPASIATNRLRGVKHRYGGQLGLIKIGTAPTEATSNRLSC